jgi:hypothetical protein
MKTCSLPACDRPYSAKGLCKPHYEQQAYLAQRGERIARARNRYRANREEILLARRRAAHGIDEVQYEAMVTAQNGACAICQGKPRGRKTRLCVDHCHASGRIRGLLCDACNRAIGLLGDDPVRLRAAAHYLTTDAAP